MSLLENAVKKSLPSLVGSLKDWLSVKVEIRLFGVKIFTFVWPPESDDKPGVVESNWFDSKL